MIFIKIGIRRTLFWFDYTKWVRRGIPQSWNDFTIKKRLQVLRLVALAPKTAVQLEVLRRILNLSKADFLQVNDEDMETLAEHIDWLFDEPSPTPIITEFTYRGITYHLPAADFANGIAMEFALADDAYNDWADDANNQAALLRLVATLARPAHNNPDIFNKTGDIRQPIISEYEITERAKAFESLDFGIVIAVMRYFIGVKRKVYQSGVALGIFDPPQLTKENELIETPDTDPLFGWWTCFRNIAKTAVMGSEEQVWRVNFWRMFSFLREEKKRADDAEAAAKKASRMD